MNKKNMLDIIVPTILFAIAFLIYFRILTRYPLVYGIDGPYYLIQIRSLIENGSLKYGDPPLVFLMFYLFSRIFEDLILGVKFGTALMVSLISFPLYKLLLKISGNRIASLSTTIIALFSPQIFRLMEDLLKNAVGCLFLLSFLYYLHKTIENGKRNDVLLAVLFLVLTGLTHILTLGMAILFLILYPIFYAILRREYKSVLKRIFPIIASLVLFTAIALTLFYNYFTDFFKGEAFIEDLISSEGASLMHILRAPMNQIVIAVLVSGVILCIYNLYEKNCKPLLLTSLVVGSLLILPVIPGSWLWRFTLMEFIPVSLILGLKISSVGKKGTTIALAILFITIILFQSMPLVQNIKPTITMNDYKELKEIKAYIPENSAVLTSNPRIRYWIEYICKCDIIRKPNLELSLKYEHIFLLYDKQKPSPIPPKAIKVYVGSRFVLFELKK